MPVFEVQGPDGGVYEVEATDEAHALTAFGPTPKPEAKTESKPGMPAALDVGFGYGSGVGRGIASIPGFAGDVQQLARMAPWAPKRSMLDGLLEKAGFSKDLPTSEDTIKAASKLIPEPEYNADGSKHVPFMEYKPQTTAGQYAQRIGEFIPNVFGGEGNIAAKALRYTAAPAVASKMAEDAAQGTGLEGLASAAGAVAGGIGGGLIREPGRAAKPALATTKGVFSQNPAIAKDVKTLEDAGVRLKAGDRTGNERLRWLEDFAEKAPFGRRLQDESRGDLNKAFFEKAGVASHLDPETKQFKPETWLAGDKNFEHWYDAINSKSHVKFDPAFNNALGSLEKGYHDWTNASGPTKGVTDWFDKIRDIGVNGGQLAGPDAQQWRSELVKVRKGLNHNSAEHTAIDGMVKLLDSSLEANTPAHLQGARQKVNRAYSNYKLLEDAAKAAGSRKGYISPAIADQLASRRNNYALQRGTSDIGSLARAAENVMKEKPSSGTTERGMAAMALSTAGGLMAVPKAAAASRLLTSGAMQRFLGGTSRKAIPGRKATPIDKDAIIRAGILGLLGGSN